ncbi:MAG: phage tail tape measure protein, partial [Synergistaceae bacterium]|nr:phage tail tape measure protein [Synergistaceae bacterium]
SAQTDRVANSLAQTSAASNTNIAELGEAMKYVAPIASGLGISIEQTNAMLGVMANNAIKGSQAGTSLRAALLRLSKEPKAVAKALGELGIKATDTQGRLREMPELMQALSKRLAGMGEAKQMQYLSNIFGSEASAGMLAIMKSSVDGSLQQLEFLNKASDGVISAILEHVNKGAEKSVISFEEMQKGMQNSSYYAENLGISVNDLAVNLALLARAGIKNEKADVALSAAFKQLKEQPAKVQKALKQFNISMTGSNGEMKGFNELIQEVKTHVMGLEQTKRLNILDEIFGKGSGEAIQALMKTMTDGTLEEYKKIQEKAQSISSEMAGKNQNTLAGQLTILGSAWSQLLETIGTDLAPIVKIVVRGLQSFLDCINGLNSSVPGLSTAVSGLIATFAGYVVFKRAFTICKSLAGLYSAWTVLTTAQATATGVLTAAQTAQTTATTTLTGATGALNTVLAACPIGLLIGLIAGLVAVGYVLYKNWDKIKELGMKMWVWIQEKAQAFADWWDSWTLAD